MVPSVKTTTLLSIVLAIYRVLLHSVVHLNLGFFVVFTMLTMVGFMIMKKYWIRGKYLNKSSF